MNEKNQLARPFALPLPTIRRYPVYLRCINEMIAAGETHISSAVVAEKLGLDSVLARKDLAMAGVPGKPRRGYPARELQAAITAALGWDNSTDAVLVGVGSLGNALLGYRGFEEQSLSIAAAFGSFPALREITATFTPAEASPLVRASPMTPKPPVPTVPKVSVSESKRGIPQATSTATSAMVM